MLFMYDEVDREITTPWYWLWWHGDDQYEREIQENAKWAHDISVSLILKMKSYVGEDLFVELV